MIMFEWFMICRVKRINMRNVSLFIIKNFESGIRITICGASAVTSPLPTHRAHTGPDEEFSFRNYLIVQFTCSRRYHVL